VPRYMLMSDGISESLLREELISVETDLQRAFAEHPSLIPGDDLGLPSLMVVGREVSVPSGSIDLLCLTQKGTPVLVEFKKGPENSDSRRVVAQLMDYGAHLWGLTVDDFALTCSRTLTQLYGTGSIQAVFERCFGAATQEDEATSSWSGFQEGLGRALESGQFHYLVVTTHLDDILKQTMRYLGEVGGLNIAGIEVDHFSDEGRHMYVPSAYTVRNRSRRPASGMTTFEAFLQEASPDARPVWQDLIPMLESLEERVDWGKKGFAYHIDLGRPFSLLWGYPNGSVGGVDVLFFNWPEPDGSSTNEVLAGMAERLTFLGERMQLIRRRHGVKVGAGGLGVADLPQLRQVLGDTIVRLREVSQ